MSNLKEYHVNVELFRKRLILRTIAIFFVNFILLGWTVWSLPKENFYTYSGVCFLLLVAIGLFLNQNFKKQVLILNNNYLEMNNHILQWYTGNGMCTTINLKRVSKIERDKYRAFDRFILFEGKESHSIINLKKPDEFQKELETFTKLKVEYFVIDWRERILKAVGYFFPAFVGATFSYLGYVDLRFFFLILTVNSIFFLIQFSEKRTRGGFSESSVRRSTIILFLLLAYQLLILFST